MNQIKKRKIFCTLLISCMIISNILTGCGSGKSSKVNTETESANVTAPGQLPIVKEKTKITIGIPSNSNVQDYNTNAYTKWLEEKTNIDLEFNLFPTQGYIDKLQLMLASNSELPDLLIGLSVTDDTFLKYPHKFTKLNDYIDKYGYWTKEMFDKTVIKNIRKYMTSADGNIYYMPYVVEQTGNMWGGKAWINQVWLDKLGLKMPETTEDFYKVLKAFKDRDPNGDGTQDEIPYTGSNSGWNEIPYDFLFNSFIYDDRTNYYTVNDGKVDVAFDKEEWRDGLRYMNMLAKEGLYDMQSFTQDNKTLKTLAQHPNTNIIGAFASGSPDALFSTDPNRLGEYVPLPPLKGPKGVQFAHKQEIMPRCMGMISKNCKEPLAAFRLMDFMLSEESALRARYGVPGTDWKEAGPDDKCIFDSIGRQAKVIPILPYGTPQNSHWLSYHPVFRSVENSDGMAWNGDPMDFEYFKAKAITAYMDKGPKEVVAKQIFNLEQSQEVADLRNTINPFVKEHIAKFILKDCSDQDWNDYLGKLDKMGLKRYVELSQIGYDNVTK